MLIEPPTLQLAHPWQQQQQPVTAPAPTEWPQSLVVNSEHRKLVADAAAAGEGTAIE
jgi:hypothetical protein